MVALTLEDKQRIKETSIPETNSGCWLWEGACDRNGYGWIWWNKKRWYAHRASYTAFVESIPEGLCVLHSCDTPSCVNPRHLWVGCRADNNADMLTKGRGKNPPYLPEQNVGEKHGLAKLREYEVLEILSLRKQGLSQREIARRFAVDRSQVSRICQGLRWAHLQTA
jgi:hypothetical protein